MAEKVKHKFRKEFLYYCAVALLAVARVIPARVIFAIGTFGGWCAYYLLGRERRRTLANLALAYRQEKSAAERARIARAVFVNLGRNLSELALYPRLDDAQFRQLVTMEGKEIIDRELRKGKGVLIITGHIGNWELFPSYIIMSGYSGGVVARRAYYEKYERLLLGLRRSKGFRVFYRDESPKAVLRTLRNNEIIGILADQDVRKLDGVFVEFFGIPAYTPTAPVLIAMTSGAPLVPARIVREGRRHRILVEEPIVLRATGDRKSDLVYNTQQWSRCIERYIRARPEQWVWMHRRWRTRPEDVAGRAGAGT
ncbi:MAG: lysophospholipid acyltransferase family protein [Candidatus Aureabacteria bacterium]|nr:lysophospholipid acyltransferase family protein [Candidatus Auribacterota bacterium]